MSSQESVLVYYGYWADRGAQSSLGDWLKELLTRNAPGERVDLQAPTTMLPGEYQVLTIVGKKGG